MARPLALLALAAAVITATKAPPAKPVTTPEVEPVSQSKHLDATGSGPFTAATACAGQNELPLPQVQAMAMNLFNRYGEPTGERAVLCVLHGPSEPAAARNGSTYDLAPNSTTVAAVIISEGPADAFLIDDAKQNFPPGSNPQTESWHSTTANGAVNGSQLVDVTSVAAAGGRYTATFFIGAGFETADRWTPAFELHFDNGKVTPALSQENPLPHPEFVRQPPQDVRGKIDDRADLRLLSLMPS